MQNETEARILEWCRARRAAVGMRNGHASDGPDRQCLVMRIDGFMPRAFNDDGTPTSALLACGPTWEAVWELLASVPAESAPPPPVLSATYAKLGSEWGIRVYGGPVKSGDVVTVTKKSGEKKTETIASVLSSVTGGASVCTIVPTERPAGRSARERGGRRYGSTYTRFSSGAESFTNRNGRCEDAPCCGCCS